MEKRESERLKLERKQKEEEWEKELATAMGENINLDESSADRCSTRTQDGCDILVNSDIYKGFGRVHSISDDCCARSGDEKSDKLNEYKNSKCGDKSTANSLEETEPSQKEEECSKVKYGSEGDFMNIKKKSAKISFERGIFSLKEKGSTNRLKKHFARASSLKTPCRSESPSNEEEISDVSGKLRDFSDDVRSRIAKSPKLKQNSKSPSEAQRSTSTYAADPDYQKTKNEVVKNYQASLNSSLKNTDNG